MSLAIFLSLSLSFSLSLSLSVSHTFFFCLCLIAEVMWSAVAVLALACVRCLIVLHYTLRQRPNVHVYSVLRRGIACLCAVWVQCRHLLCLRTIKFTVYV
jgi:hypothetical protein